MIKFVYFDMGGVLISDFSDGTGKWGKMKEIMGVKKEFDKEFDGLYDDYERRGLCLNRKVDTLIPIFSKKFGMSFPPGFSMQDYFVDHFDPNPDIWPIVKQVKKKFKVGVLTNMYVDMLDLIEKKDILPPVKWDAVVDSTKVGYQKPDPKIYEISTEMSGVGKDEILFVDNSKRNIEGAKSFGWETFFYNSKDHKESCAALEKFLQELI